MSTFRRMLVAVGAPLVVVIGLGVMWGVRNASQLKAQVEAWADSLEHSPNPVTMDLAFLPAYVDGDKVGKLDAIVIQRHQPATVDSVRIVIASGGDYVADRLAGCALHLDPDALSEDGPFGFKHALQCVTDTTALVRFGSVMLEGLSEDLALYLDGDDLPCEHMVEGDTGACTEVRKEIHRLRDEIRNEIRVNIRRDLQKKF
ncbi:MAG: hypothetical protein OER90_17735 [Gemmatimonadota bacterium]|nr:hypothetical protein [Gemmatimonadota bacterium]